MKHFQKSLFCCQLAARCSLHLTPFLCLTPRKKLYSSISSQELLKSLCVFCSNSSTPPRPAVFQERRKKRRDAASRELSNETGKKCYSFVPFTAEGYFVLPGFTRYLRTVKRFWNLLIIQTSCISQLYGQTNTRKRF